MNKNIYITIAVAFVLVGGLLSFFFPSNSTTLLTSDELFEKGQYYFNHGDTADGAYDLEKAAEFYRLSLEKDGHPLALYQLGRIEFLDGRLDSAIHLFQQQQERYGDLEPKVYYMLGLTYAYKAMGEDNSTVWQAAEENFIKYIDFVDDAPWPAVDLAWVYFMQGKYAEMKPVLETAVEQHPDNPWVLNMYGLTLLNLEDDPSAARAYFSKAKNEAVKLTVSDWGNVYPGNNPAHWNQGLEEFILVIDKNLSIATPK